MEAVFLCTTCFSLVSFVAFLFEILSLFQFVDLASVLVHFLPLAESTLDTQGSNTNSCCVLDPSLCLLLASFVGGHFSFLDEFVAPLVGFHTGVNTMSSVNGGDSGKAGGE